MKCEDCEHFHPLNEKRPDYKCMCMMFPVKLKESNVRAESTTGDPYNYCQDINKGYCPLYQPQKTNQKELEV